MRRFEKISFAQFKKDNVALTQFVKDASDKQKENIQYLIKVRQLNKMKLILKFFTFKCR